MLVLDDDYISYIKGRAYCKEQKLILAIIEQGIEDVISPPIVVKKYTNPKTKHIYIYRCLNQDRQSAYKWFFRDRYSFFDKYCELLNIDADLLRSKVKAKRIAADKARRKANIKVQLIKK